jgi:hypothetical protein
MIQSSVAFTTKTTVFSDSNDLHEAMIFDKPGRRWYFTGYRDLVRNKKYPGLGINLAAWAFWPALAVKNCTLRTIPGQAHNTNRQAIVNSSGCQ